MQILQLISEKTSPYYDFDKQVFNNCNFNVRLSPVGAFGYRPTRHKRSSTFEDRKREQVSSFTPSSRFRLQKRVRELEARLRVFGRLSYPGKYPSDGRIVKGHWNSLVKRIFRKLKVDKGADGKYYAFDGRLFSILWFFEFQDRGAPHYHFLCTHYIDKQWLANAWFEIVGSGEENHRKFGTRVEKFDGCRSKLARYAGKYACKSEQKVIPESFKNSGRFWGVAGTNSIAAATLCFDAFDEDLNMKSVTVMTEIVGKGVFLGSRFHKIEHDNESVIGYWFNVETEEQQEKLVKEIIRFINDAAKNVL